MQKLKHIRYMTTPIPMYVTTPIPMYVTTPIPVYVTTPIPVYVTTPIPVYVCMVASTYVRIYDVLKYLRRCTVCAQHQMCMPTYVFV